MAEAPAAASAVGKYVTLVDTYEKANSSRSSSRYTPSHEFQQVPAFFRQLQFMLGPHMQQTIHVQLCAEVFLFMQALRYSKVCLPNTTCLHVLNAVVLESALSLPHSSTAATVMPPNLQLEPVFYAKAVPFAGEDKTPVACAKTPPGSAVWGVAPLLLTVSTDGVISDQHDHQ